MSLTGPGTSSSVHFKSSFGVGWQQSLSILPNQGKAEILPHTETITEVTSIMDSPTLGLWHRLQTPYQRPLSPLSAV